MTMKRHAQKEKPSPSTIINSSPSSSPTPKGTLHASRSQAGCSQALIASGIELIPPHSNPCPNEGCLNNLDVRLKNLEVSPRPRCSPAINHHCHNNGGNHPHCNGNVDVCGDIFCETPCSSQSDNVKSKREKMGLFRNLRRKLSSFRKSDSRVECNGQLEESQSQSLNLSCTNSSRLRDRHKKENSHEHTVKNSSLKLSDSDHLNSHLQKIMSPKFRDWHSNTNTPKEKHCCLSKNLSELQTPEWSNRNVSVSGDVLRVDMSSCSRISDIGQSNSNMKWEYPDDGQSSPPKEQGKVWSLTQELYRLSKFGWYWGPITRNEAEEKLDNQQDGAFLVRDSSDERYLLSLSFRSNGITLHTRIEHCNGMFSFYAQPDSDGYPSIVDLIQHSMNASQSSIFYYSHSYLPDAPQYPVRLTKPVSRFTQVRSLQYLCRFVIRQYTRYDHIQHLPLPTTLKGWIEENQY